MWSRNNSMTLQTNKNWQQKCRKACFSLYSFKNGARSRGGRPATPRRRVVVDDHGRTAQSSASRARASYFSLSCRLICGAITRNSSEMLTITGAANLLLSVCSFSRSRPAAERVGVTSQVERKTLSCDPQATKGVLDREIRHVV